MRSGYPDNAFISVPSFGDVRGVPSYEPALQATLKIVTAGLPDDASALFLVTGQVQADSGRMADLGTAEPVFEQLSYGPDQPRQFDSQVRWRLSSAGVERLEQIRAGGGFTMSVGVRYGLLGGTGHRTGANRTGRSGCPTPTSRSRSSSRPTTGRRMSWSLCSRRRQCHWSLPFPRMVLPMTTGSS